MCAFIESPVSRITGHQFNFDLCSCSAVINLVEHSRRLLGLFSFLSFHPLANLRGHLAANVV
jgi:hypothetical protein